MFYKKRRPWTGEEERRILEMRAAGQSAVTIAKAIKRTSASVSTKLSNLSKVGREKSDTSLGLRAMATFKPWEPAILHDRITDKIETWTGEDAADFQQNSVSNLDGSVEWRQFVFDAWGTVLGG